MQEELVLGEAGLMGIGCFGVRDGGEKALSLPGAIPAFLHEGEVGTGSTRQGRVSEAPGGPVGTLPRWPQRSGKRLHRWRAHGSLPGDACNCSAVR